jgi:hypothetical protein
MKTAFSIAVLAVLLIAPRQCVAVWGIEPVSRERAKELGMEVRSASAGHNHLRVELKFQTKGELNRYTEGGSSSDPSRVELRIGKGDNLLVTAPLREDRSKRGRIVVGFTADRGQLDKLSLRVMVAEGLGGSAYDLRVKNFVEPKKGR